MDERYLEIVEMFDSKFTVEETYSHSELKVCENEESFVVKNVNMQFTIDGIVSVIYLYLNG